MAPGAAEANGNLPEVLADDDVEDTDTFHDALEDVDEEAREASQRLPEAAATAVPTAALGEGGGAEAKKKKVTAVLCNMILYAYRMPGGPGRVG